ncbi:autotransporter family protein [Pontiella sulfatireligans]|uniref:Outer membrane protein B n=1 Tax=Pontiella sulfatireligans TaxID=2750658 RepID=A0A6C2UPV6_9BACT|nr:autotransporter domain-containing protein [Pontiella sulfatireligans]VGO21347.1 Outer membrane protein B [Pontiella sulfatireligans]
MKFNCSILPAAVLVLSISALSAFGGDIKFDSGQPASIEGAITNGTTLFVGEYANNNALTISNAGGVSVANAQLGQFSDNNSILVSGELSSLQVEEKLTIGQAGDDNSLTAADGGWIVVGESDPGLLLGVNTGIMVGNTNGTAQLSTGEGSSINADFLYLGAGSNDTGRIDLSGSGSQMTVADTAYVGYEGSGSELLVGGGATLTVSNLLQIGTGANSNNVLNINSGGKAVIAGTVAVNNPGENTINVNSGGRITYTGNANLDNAAALGVNFNTGSTLEAGGELTYGEINDGLSIVLNNSLNTNLTASWDTGSDNMYVGKEVGGNSLTLLDGAQAAASSADAIIGQTSNNNSIDVEGDGSLLDISGQLLVGVTSDSNALNLSDGGEAQIGTDLILGLRDAANDNEVNLSGEDTLLTVGGAIIVGQDGIDNSLNLSDGAAAVAQSLQLGQSAGADGNSATLSDDALLDIAMNVELGSASSDNSLTVDNAALDIGGGLFIGADGSDNAVTLTGSNAWINAGGMLLGGSGSDNSLDIEAGAKLMLAGDAFLGTNSANNSIYVTGTNSLLDISGSLTMGTLAETNSNSGNTLSAFDAARIAIGLDLNVGNGSLIKIESGSQVTVDGDYTQDASSTLELSVGSSNMGLTNLVVGGTASFASNTTIHVFDAGITGPTNEFDEVAVAAGELLIDDLAATTALLNNTNVINFVNDLLGIDAMVADNSIVLKTEFLPIAENSGLTGTYLEPVADEIDGLAKAGGTNAISMRNIMGVDMDEDGRNQAMKDYYGKQESTSPGHNIINMGIQSVSEQLTMRADSTRARMGSATSSTINPEAAPEGAMGPHAQGQELQGWISAFNTWVDQSKDGNYRSYDGSMGGFMIGADFSVAENLLVGVAGGASSSDMDQDRGGKVETDTTYGAIYASAGTKDWYIDSSLLYGGSTIKHRLGNVFKTKADYDAQNMAFYLGGGKEYTGDYLIITPQVSMLANYYSQDSYKEKSKDAVGRKVDSFDQFYFQSSIGCSLGMYTSLGETTLRPEVRIHWLHEFNASEEDLDYRLIGGSGNYKMELQAPEKDILKIGAGVVAKMGEYLELRADLDTRQGDNYSDFTMLGSIRYQF